MGKKSWFNIGRLFLCAMVLVSCCLLTACGGVGSAVTITIAGKEVPMDGKLQKCIDNGLITTDTRGDKEELTTTMKAREASFHMIHLGNSEYPRKCPAYVMCYNSSDSSKSVYDCRIMTFYYNPEADSADQAQVLINGIDFWGMTEDDALAALEDKGVKVDYDTMHESHFNVFNTGKVSWTIESKLGSHFDSESDSPQKAVVEFDDNTYYISSVKLSITSTLNLKFE